MDIYLPLDEREEANEVVWPKTKEKLAELLKVIKKCGFEADILNPQMPISRVDEGMRVIKKARGERFIVFLAVGPILILLSAQWLNCLRTFPSCSLAVPFPIFPAMWLFFAAASGLEHVGIKTQRMFIEKFDQPETLEDELAAFLKEGRIKRSLPKPIEIKVTERARQRARQVKEKLRGMIYGAVGPRPMQMWNKISEADFLRYFGVAREGFDGLRLLKMTENIWDERAEKAFNFLRDNGMVFKLGSDPQKYLTREMVLFQLKVYFALLELKDRYGLDFLGVQDQLDWIEYYPATDLALGLLNNQRRPESDGTTVVAATEADDGAAITMQVLKLLSGGQPVGFNDLRYWDSKKGLYWLVNSGALAPYFAYGRHDSLEGSWSERQPYMYFKHGGGTCSVVCRIPGVVTWARFSYRNHRLYLCAGRGVTAVPTEEEWRRRSERCDPQWPHWYLKLCGQIEWKINFNHPLTIYGDYLAELKALAEELGIPFECYDHLQPKDLA